MPVRTAALQSLCPDTRARVTAALSALHVPVTPASSPPSPGDVDIPIIVLGNGLNPDGSVHPNLENRLNLALEEASLRPNAPIVVTGGPTTHGFVEAQAMRDWLINHGVSEERLLVEGQAQSTVDNARFTRTLLPHAESITIVTSANQVDSIGRRNTLIMEVFEDDSGGLEQENQRCS